MTHGSGLSVQPANLLSVRLLNLTISGLHKHRSSAVKSAAISHCTESSKLVRKTRIQHPWPQGACVRPRLALPLSILGISALSVCFGNTMERGHLSAKRARARSPSPSPIARHMVKSRRRVEVRRPLESGRNHHVDQSSADRDAAEWIDREDDFVLGQAKKRPEFALARAEPSRLICSLWW